MSIEKISGVAFSALDEFSGVAKASIANVSGVTATPPFITTNLRNRYTPSNYSGSGNWLDEVGSIDLIINGATYSSTQPANFDSDGVNDDIVSAGYTQQNTDMSWGLWFNQDPNPASPVINGGYTINNGRGSITYQVNGRMGQYYLGSNGSLYSPTSYVTPSSAWVYMCWSRNASTKRIQMWMFDSTGVTQIVNAIGPDQTTALNSLVFTSPLVSHFNGKHGEYHLYEDDLSTADWTQNFNALKGYYGL